MSKVTIGILFAAIALIIVATYYDIAYLGGGPGVLLVVGLSYSYVVARQQAELLSHALHERDEKWEHPLDLQQPANDTDVGADPVGQVSQALSHRHRAKLRAPLGLRPLKQKRRSRPAAG